MAKPKKKKCDNCQKDYVLARFYNTNSPLSKDGKMSICKTCVKDMIDYSNMDSVYKILQLMDIPFDYDYWESAKKSEEDTLGTYLRMANSLNQLKGKTWNDSSFKSKMDNGIENLNINIDSNEENLEHLKEKYGYGFPDAEYAMFEKKYQQLRPSFQLLTTMHDEMLREYCINKVKETLAKAKGDFKQAKEWATMAKDVATSGKLNPSQMSKADLSGGMDTFGQLVRMVEQEQDIIPLLPKFVEKPKDKVDVVLWHYINYIRDLKGLPECDYKEIYEFYARRKEDYENNMLDNEFMNTVEDVDGRVVLDFVEDEENE